jgi:peptidyl-prolyl cis-trans isomerase SurA
MGEFRMKKIAVLLGLGLVGSLLLAPSVRAEVIDRIVAVVNDSIITQSDITGFQKKLKTKGLLDESLLNLYDSKRLLAEPKYLIDYMIDEKTIDSEIRRQGLVSPVEQVESEIGNIAKARHFDRNQLKAALKNEGIAYSDYQDFIKTSLQRQTLMQKEVSSKIKISDEEVSSYYMAQHPNADTLVFEYSLAHIVFTGANGGPEEAVKRAKEVKEKLAQGLPFESLAAQFSEDPQFVQGGVFGTFRLTDFNKDVRDVMRNLGAGDVSPVVKMANGYQIFKVLKKTLVPSPDLDEKREEIRRVLMSENFKRQYRSWIEQKRRDSFIRINQ